MVSDASQDVAQVGLGVESVELSGADQGIDRRRTFPTIV